jgi:hypothetical protein
MGFVRLSRVLWRRRLAVGVGALLAVLAAVALVARATDTPASTSALSKVLIDTPKSLAAAAQAPGAGTIYPRARLLGALVANQDAVAAIARRAGLAPGELAISGPGAAAPPRVITPLAEQAVEVAKPLAPYLLAVEVSPGQPILSIDAYAPTPAAAVALGHAAVATLPAIAAGAPGGGDSVAIEPLGRPLVITTPARGHAAKAVAMAVVFFGLWCLGCVVFDRMRLAAGRRRAWHELRGALE